MKELLTIDLHNYQDTWPKYVREAAKAVIFIDHKLVMLQSNLGDVKFVGGGIEANESHLDCLIREVREETGYEVIPSSIHEIGMVIERRKDKFEDAIWEMVSYMYSCEVDSSTQQELKLTDHERKHGMTSVTITPSDAIATNEEALKNQTYTEWLYRDLEILKLLFRK